MFFFFILLQIIKLKDVWNIFEDVIDFFCCYFIIKYVDKVKQLFFCKIIVLYENDQVNSEVVVYFECVS